MQNWTQFSDCASKINPKPRTQGQNSTQFSLSWPLKITAAIRWTNSGHWPFTHRCRTIQSPPLAIEIKTLPARPTDRPAGRPARRAAGYKGCCDCARQRFTKLARGGDRDRRRKINAGRRLTVVMRRLHSAGWHGLWESWGGGGGASMIMTTLISSIRCGGVLEKAGRKT